MPRTLARAPDAPAAVVQRARVMVYMLDHSKGAAKVALRQSGFDGRRARVRSGSAIKQIEWGCWAAVLGAAPRSRERCAQLGASAGASAARTVEMSIGR